MQNEATIWKLFSFLADSLICFYMFLMLPSFIKGIIFTFSHMKLSVIKIIFICPFITFSIFFLSFTVKYIKTKLARNQPMNQFRWINYASDKLVDFFNASKKHICTQATDQGAELLSILETWRENPCIYLSPTSRMIC